jgi:Epoxide hydrolase N terminus
VSNERAVRSFSVNVPEEELVDPHRRVVATRWPDRETEERLNALPHFVTELDGLDIHFVHVRSPHPNAPPHCPPRNARLRLRRAEPPGEVHRHLHQPVHRHRRLRQHAVIAGDGPPLLLACVWPKRAVA